MEAPLVDIYLNRFSSNMIFFVCIEGSKNKVDARW
jgi:hypothetical protein